MLCVYAVVRASHPGVDGPGVHRRPTALVRSGDLGAIVSETDGELLARRRDVDAHLTVLEQALMVGDVLPLRFGALVDDANAVRSLLDRSGPRFRELLARVGGRVQMTVKLVRDDDAAVRHAVDNDARLRRFVTARRSATVWAEKLTLGEQIAIVVERLSKQDVDAVTRRLSAVAECISVGAAAPPAVASIALLVHPQRLGELDRLVASLHDELGDRLTIDYAGPMPAYSFVG